jgi:L-cysteine/cystine lyase
VNVDAIRSGLPVLEHVAYLNTGTFGPLPRRTTEAMTAQHRAELEGGRSGQAYWELARGLRVQARAAIAELVGAPADAVALMRSTTDGCNVAVASLRLGQEDEIVTTDDEHFGLLGALHASGARVRVAQIRARPPDAALAAVEAEIGERTRLIALSHVTWTTGRILPVAELAGRGIPVLVDGAQSAGAIPLNVAELGCDFYTVSGQKWLLGPDGTGGLYVRPDRLEQLAIPFPSYYSQDGYESTGEFRPVAGAVRFDVGTIPAASLLGLVESIAFANEAGRERFARARAMAERCRAALAERFEVLTEPGQATLVSFRPGGDPEAAVATLAERGVILRGFTGLDWIRASIGFWTSEGDLDRLVDGLP